MEEIEIIAEISVLVLSPLMIGILLSFQIYQTLFLQVTLIDTFYITLGCLMVIDALLSLVVLRKTVDYVKHRYYRINIGILSIIFFFQIFFVFPASLQSNKALIIINFNWITLAFLCLKMPLIGKIILHYQRIAEAIEEFR